MVLGIGSNVVEIIIRAKDEFSRTMNNFQKGIKQVEKASRIFALAGVAIAAGLGFAIKTSIEFESAFTGVRKTVELTEKGFKDLENRFKTLSTEIPVSFVELSKIGEIAGQLGVTGVDDLEKFTKTIAEIAVTTNLTAESAATSFARIANIMQIPISEIDRMGSTVVELGNNFATTESEIVEFANRIAASAKIVGINTQNVFGIATAFTSVGIQAEAGGTAVGMVLQGMNKAILESSDKLALLEKTAGLAVGEFEELFRRDAIVAFELFVTGLGESGTAAAQILDDLGLGSSRLIRAFTSVAEAGGLLGKTISTSNIAFKDNTALTVEAGKKFGILESRLKILKNEFLLFADEVGAALTPLFDELLIPGISGTISIFRELPESLRENITEFAAIFSIVSLITGAFILMTLIIGTTIGAFVGLGVFLVVATGIIFGTMKMVRSLRDEEGILLLFTLKMGIGLIDLWDLVAKSIIFSINLILAPLRFMIKMLNLLSTLTGGRVQPLPEIPKGAFQFKTLKTKEGKSVTDEIRARIKQVEAANLFAASTFTPLPEADIIRQTNLPDADKITINVFLDGEELMSRAQSSDLAIRTSI